MYLADDGDEMGEFDRNYHVHHIQIPAAITT